MGDLTRVTIDFETSHLIFPTLIACVLGLLGLAILITRRHAIARTGRFWREVFGQMDRRRFLGTIVLTLIYFSLMVPLGSIWPNLGLGFLICSIPFVFLTGFLYMHERTARDILPLAIVAVAAPTLTWWLFTYLFFLTLP